MSLKLKKRYNPAEIENKIYKFWEKGSFFSGKIMPRKKPFVITLPPPNVTGNLHAGHALYLIEDIVVRRKKMLGIPTLWLPGFDHASIAVEYLVAKQLKKEGKSKQNVGQKEFLKRAKKFAIESRKEIKNQLKKLGFALDWEREAYTMDKIRAQAVKEAFLRLYKKGLIYQGEYIVNWCPSCKTAISDLENIRREEAGKLYYLKYGPITIATTRPETIFADLAVAIHPSNKKYKNLIGSLVPLPLTNKKIPVIKDSLVDPNFGTGALKITPAHDELDFQIGKRHQLKPLIGINANGKLTEAAGKYAGLNREEARQKVAKDLVSGGFVEKIENISHSIGYCERCGAKVEPLISKQWFLKIGPLAEKAIEAVEKGKIKIIPKRFEKVYFHWLRNIKDWCISRQLWWGHKIPLKGVEDTLDTWFSSSLWPISVFGWPKETKDYKYFYPTTLRETGYDILFFWTAREIMMCLEMTGKIPFKTVYLHGLVRDEQGRKFSKTAKIGFDPLEMTAKYGTDALRMALVFGSAPGSDIRINDDKVKAMRNFANKIWNAARFVLIDKSALNSAEICPEQRGNISENQRLNQHKSAHPDDKWILKELNKTIKKVNACFDKYRFDLAANEIYHFFWHTFCDKYIEMGKKRRKEAQPTLLYVLMQSLKLLHPFMPFITEEIYQKLPVHPVKSAKGGAKQFNGVKNKKKSIMIENWPK